MNLKKLWPILGLLCMCFLSTASAHPYSNNSQSDSMSSNPQDMSGKGTYQRGSYREMTPAAGPRVAHGADIFITANFIWWKTVQEGTDYAFTGTNVDGSAPEFASPSKGTQKSSGEDWSPGFKVGLGLNMGHDGWDIYAQYTWLRPSNNSSLSSSTGVSPTFSVPVFPNISRSPSLSVNTSGILASTARSSWDLDFNVIDLELGRNFYLSQFLTMRPFIGLKGTWQQQCIRHRYSDLVDLIPIGIDQGLLPMLQASGTYKVNEDMDNWGIGVRGGFNVAWYMAKQWSIYGDLAWTTMWTKYYDVSRKDTLDIDSLEPLIPGAPDTITYLNVEADDHYAIKHIIELELGLRWEIWFYDDNYHFAVQAGWEEQVWNNWGTSIDTLNRQSWEDLSFHGLNLKFRFDF